jgi:hypothetical protein
MHETVSKEGDELLYHEWVANIRVKVRSDAVNGFDMN